jgi:DNA modification methylase
VIDLMQGDCLEMMKGISDNSVDSIVTDPPYGLKFMGKTWDCEVPSQEIWEECLRVLKPGGHLLAFAGTRTQHRMACRIEDAGFEIRDMITWNYGSGFPKSLNVSKSIDKAAGAKREVIGVKKLVDGSNARKTAKFTNATEDISGFTNGGNVETAPTTDEAKQWDGWGTALKPSIEPITVARKPLSEKTVASNMMKWGTGGINIDGCRIEYEDTKDPATNPLYRKEAGYKNKQAADINSSSFSLKKTGSEDLERNINSLGRWPANFIHDGSDEVLALFPHTKSGAILPHHITHESENRAMSGKNYARGPQYSPSSEGSAARFFYCAKASKKDRNEGCEELPFVNVIGYEVDPENPYKSGHRNDNNIHQLTMAMTGKVPLPQQNNHPTVKPTTLMKYLCRLVTQPNGIVLDPFMGSGSTGKAAILENFQFIGIEIDEGYFEIAQNRINEALMLRDAAA